METIRLAVDGTMRDYPEGATGESVAKSLGAGRYKSACALEVNGEQTDLRDRIESGAEVRILGFDDSFGEHAFWHSSAHLMAHALTRLYPGIRLAIGPAIQNGFYYDVDSEHVFTPDDFDAIEAVMRAIVKENIPIERFSLPKDEALSLMHDQEYKEQLITELPEDARIFFYKQGDFTDLCAGPHLLSTGPIRAFKLTGVTGAYWKGDAKNKMLQRLYGISFPKADMLEQHLLMLEEAKRRDHRKLGKELQLFELFDEGPGFPVFLPNGMILRNELENLWREEHRKAGYHEIKTPIILSRGLWETSGHWMHYKENMYTTEIDEQDYAIKPMNCPGALLVYKEKRMSYRDLPYRLGELGQVHRHELSGALHGLMRVRSFTQDDAHIFMTEEQIEREIKGVIELVDRIYGIFGLSYDLELSTRPDSFLGEISAWDAAEAALKSALDQNGKPYKINPGDGAFYGPKIDFHVWDSLGRRWQCATIQLDYQLPERFQISYIGADGEKHRPIMIHRVVFGSIERFIAILTEHFAGAFPLWIAPMQAIVIPISERNHAYADEVEETLRNAGIRVQNDKRSEKMGYKIREAEMLKIPYMLVVGEREQNERTVSLRKYKEGDRGAVSVEQLVADLSEQIASKAL